MVSCLMFKSLSHFEFIFVYGVGVCSSQQFFLPISQYLRSNFSGVGIPFPLKMEHHGLDLMSLCVESSATTEVKPVTH